MLPVRIDHACQREVALGRSMRPVAADLRLIDLPDLVAYLKTGQFETVGALVQSSIELSFKPETLAFSYSGEAHLHWGQRPMVCFDLEFHHNAVHLYFRLLLEADQAGVDITYITFDGASTNPETNTQDLIDALQDAKKCDMAYEARANCT
jgi:hypothetical protein